MVTRREGRKRGRRDPNDQKSVELAEKMLEAFIAGLGNPLDLWRSPPPVDSSSEEEDEWDPNGKLPYFPRRKINWRVANALCMIAVPLGQLEQALEDEERHLHAERYRPWPQVRLAMQAVMREVVAVGTVKKLMERDEIGLAPNGYHYIQVKDQVYLASENEGSMVYIAEADRVFVCHR
ncbi:hypothetical protein C8R45DRAFT_1017740 [Mycena sanguinolenta]|nr:hypothetical protein C8R45DRAFT_1017740 [Mycena sanguinolenta]